VGLVDQRPGRVVELRLVVGERVRDVRLVQALPAETAGDAVGDGRTPVLGDGAADDARPSLRSVATGPQFTGTAAGTAIVIPTP
jgi:hypothetical protein